VIGTGVKGSGLENLCSCGDEACAGQDKDGVGEETNPWEDREPQGRRV
jgi:hypothetical protein